MKTRFSELKGSMEEDEFNAVVKRTRYKGKTIAKLYLYLVEGCPYNQILGCSRQFIYKKLVELEERGLINTT